MFISYYQAIEIFLEKKLDENDVNIPDFIQLNQLAYAFGNHCYEDFNKSVEEQFYDFFNLLNLDWLKIQDKIFNRMNM